MEYDVTGTLKIDTESFEKALKDAQKRIDKFKKDLDSLGSLAKEIGFPELDKSLKDINKQLDNVVVDFEKVDNSVDGVVESVGDLKKETDNATNNVKNLKNEIKQVAEEGNKVDESFEKTTKRIDELKSNLKSAYNEMKNLRNEQNKIGERYSKALKKNGEQFTFAYDFYKKGDQARYEKEMEKYHKQEAELNKKFNPLFQEVNDKIKRNREEIEKYKSEIDRLEESLERVPNSFDKITEASKNAGQSVRDGLLKELQKSEEKLASLYKNFEKATEKVRSRPLLAHETSDDRIRKGIDESPKLKELNDEIKRQKWYIEDLLKEWDKLGEPSTELDKKISKIEKWTAGIKEAEVELARLRTSAENPERFYRDNQSGYYAKKELDSVMETLSKYDKPMEKINTRMKELKAEFSQLLDVPQVADRNFERIRVVEEEIDRLYQRADKRQAKISKEVRDHLNSISTEAKESAKGVDNVTKSAEKLERETKQVADAGKKAGESAKELDEYFDQATSSVKKTSAEVDALQRRINKIKLDKNFTKDFYSAVRSAEGGNGVELKPIYDNLKKDYKDLVKNKAEFERLFSNAVRRTNTRLYPSRDPDKHTNIGGRNFGYIDRKALISLDEFNKLMDKADEKVKLLNNDAEKTPTAIERSVEKLREAHSKWDELRNKMNSLKSKGASESEIEKATAEYEKQRKVVNELTTAHNKLLTSQREEKEQLTDLDKEIKNAVKSSEQLDEPFDQATSSAKKTGAEVDKLKQKFRNIYNPITNRQGLATIFDNKAQAELDKHNDFFNKTQDRIMKLKEEMTEVSGLLTDLQIKQRKAQEGLDKYGDGNRWSKKWKEDLKIIPPEIDKVRAKYESLENEVERLENEITKSGENYKKITDPLWKSVGSLQKESKKLGKMISEPIKKGTSEATKEISEFDKKVAEQMVGLNDMLVESGTFTVEQAEKVNQRIAKSINSTVHQIREGISKAQGYIKNLSAGSSGLFDEASRRSKLKREVASLNGLIEERNRLNAMWRGMQGSSDNPFTAKGMSKAKLEKQYKQQFNQFGAGFLGDANIQKDIQKVNEFHRTMRDVSASTNQWVNQEITDFNRFSKAVQTSTMEAENRLKRLTQVFSTMNTTSFRNDVGIGQLFSGTGQSQAVKNMERILAQQSKYTKMGNATGVGFAGSNQFQNLNRNIQEYNRLSNVANLNTQRMGLGFEKFGQYTEKASSNVRSLGGVLRSLRTTMSMIGGMFVWEFAFKIMDSARATISAKSEMESYYKTLHMGSKEIASFNKSLDNTISTYQKMNKFQLGETIASLGVEFKMSTDEMNQVMRVAPMIVNEYLRAGRSTEEAILAIKDISQGEFLRLSRETGVGAKEIKEAGWSGDNKDIISLYQALEKIGTARHWDVFASKAQSLNDVMLITENRMTEFVTLLSDAVTPVIVTSFNALGDAFNSASRWYEGLGSYDKAIVQITTLGTVGLTTAGVFNSHLVPAVKNVGTNLISSFLGVDSAIAKEKGLAQAIAHETAVERIANIERKGGQKVLHAKIMTLKAEELANSLGMNTTKLRMRYENLQQMAMKRGTTELKARELAQRSLILAEEQNITTTQAMNILLEEEALAEMGTAKALLVRKLGLDANIVSEEGMIVAMNEKIAESFPYISSLVSETLATIGLESATASLVVTLGLLVAPLIAIGLAVAPLIASFLDLQKSYETLADTFENGQQRINELEQKQKGYQKTIDELGSKTNLTAQEEAKLQEARDGLTYTTEALEDATNRYNKSVEYTHIVNKNIEKVEGERAKNLKEINKELEKQTGKKETIDSSYGMTTAYKEQYRTLQVIAWEEEHRPERFKKLSEGIKNTSKDQEEYNKKIQEFGNDWNQAYSDMEDAQLKRIDPNSDAFTRLWSYFDESWAIAKMDWIEFWADPFASISGELGFDGLSQSFDDALTQMGQDWDNFWQPITDFFNNFSVGGDFDPFAGLKDWWGDANAWLDSIMPDISVDGIKQWFGKNVREPFQKAWSDFWKNPFGGENKQGGQGGTPTGAKTINLSGMFKFNFGSLKGMFNSGFREALGGIPNILSSAGQLWSRLGLGNGQKTVTSVKQGLQNLKSTVQQKFNEGTNSIRTIGNSWKTNAHNTAKGVYDKIKSGLGNPAKIVREKLNEVTQAINSIRSVWGKAINNAVSVFNVDIPFFNGGIFGRVYGYGGSSSKPRKSRVRLNANAPVYGGGSNVGFETVLRTMLTKQGFRSPSSYQFYPNSQKTTQETWDSGKANCYDGASLIVALGQMFGLKGRIITGNWNGTGHAGAIVGGKLYDMTQFQRRGVFRGTQGVHFGSKGNGSYKGASTEENKKEINIHITNDLSNARIYGIDDLDNHIKQTTEKTFYELNSTDGAIGY